MHANHVNRTSEIVNFSNQPRIIKVLQYPQPRWKRHPFMQRSEIKDIADSGKCCPNLK